MPQAFNNPPAMPSSVGPQIINEFYQKKALIEAAKELDINTLWALGLPAETAPVTAGKIIKETVLNIMREKRGET